MGVAVRQPCKDHAALEAVRQVLDRQRLRCACDAEAPDLGAHRLKRHVLVLAHLGHQTQCLACYRRNVTQWSVGLTAAPAHHVVQWGDVHWEELRQMLVVLADAQVIVALHQTVQRLQRTNHEL